MGGMSSMQPYGNNSKASIYNAYGVMSPDAQTILGLLFAFISLVSHYA